MLPKALKSCPKFDKSPNLVTLIGTYVSWISIYGTKNAPILNLNKKNYIFLFIPERFVSLPIPEWDAENKNHFDIHRKSMKRNSFRPTQFGFASSVTRWLD